MVSSQILDYIREQKKAGVSREEMIKALIGSGWPVGDINSALAIIDGNPPPLSPVPPPAPASPPVLPEPMPPISAASPLPPIASPPIQFPPIQNRIPPINFRQAPPISTTFPVKPHRSLVSRPFLTIAGIAILIGLFGSTAYAFFAKIGPFASPPYTESNFSSGILMKVGEIKSSTYLASGSIVVEPREADAHPFVFDATSQPALIAKYKNDATRATDIAFILSQLRSSKTYPASIAKFANYNKSYYYGTPPSLNDPVSNQPYVYAATDGGRNFALTVTFETSDAITAVRRLNTSLAATTTVQGQTVTFTKDSSPYFYLSATPPKPFIEQLQEFATYLPAQLSASMSVGATADWSKAESADWKFNVDATGDFGDLTYKVNADALKKDGIYYVRINNIPSLLGSMANYKDQWIKFDPNAATSTSYSSMSFLTSGLKDSEASYKKERASLVSLLVKMAAAADDTKLFHFKSAPYAERVDGRLLYHYDVAVNKSAVIPFYTQVIAAVQKDPALASYAPLADQGLLDSFQGPEFDSLFAYYEANTTVTVWVDQNGFPAIVEEKLRFVPPDSATALKDKQAVLTFKLTLSGVNEPVTIETPTDSKTIQELEGSTPDPLTAARGKASDASVRANLSTIQTAAELYYAGAGNNTYGAPTTSCVAKGTLFTDATVARALTGITASAYTGNVSCASSKSSYAVEAQLTSATSNQYWCVDSTGASKASSVGLGGRTWCP